MCIRDRDCGSEEISDDKTFVEEGSEDKGFGDNGSDNANEAVEDSRSWDPGVELPSNESSMAFWKEINLKPW